MLKNLQKLMMLCLVLVGISMNASAFKLTLDYPAQGNVASIGEVKLSMPAGMETAYTGYTLTLSGPGGNENVYFDCGSLGFLGLITKPSLNITTPGTYTLTIAAGQITDYYTSAACEAQTFTWTIGGGGDPDPDPEPEPTKYSLTIDPLVANGTVAVSGNLTQAKEGDEITLSATPASGYEFGSWNVTSTLGTVSVNPSTNKFTMPAADVTISATFNAISSPSPDPTPGDYVLDFTTNHLGISPIPDWKSNESSNVNGKVFRDVTITTTGSSGNDYPTLTDFGPGNFFGVDGSFLWLNGGQTITFTVPAGYLIKGITVEYAGLAYSNGFNASVGSFSGDVWDYSTGAQTVTLTPKGADFVTKFTFVVSAPAAPTSDVVTIDSDIQYATYYNSAKAVELPAGVEGYVFGIDEDDYSMTAPQLIKVYDAGDVVPAGEPVVLTGSGDKTLNFTTTANSPVNVSYANLTGSIYNYLVGFDNDGTTTVGGYSKMLGYATGECYFYALSLNKAGETNSVGFYWMAEDGAAFLSGAHKAYLCFPKEGRNPGGGAGALAPSRFLFKQGEATAIKSVESTDNNRMMYNLNGQRVNASAKGIVIMNGKKVVK